MTPDFTHEKQAGGLVAGVDEAGRGPLAGPVTAAAVILDPRRLPKGINDSKTLPPARREAVFADLHKVADLAIGWASVEEIDRMNIRAAALLAMRRAVEGLPRVPHHALIDGNAVPIGLPCAATALVKGDARSLSIAAASIVAKVARDRVMVALAQQNPGYGWERNAGYGTPEHLVALRDLGVTPVHRRSFRPVHNLLWQEKS
ncbi:MAG: ribonuclease HII [Rhodobacteraceae bacterium]|nr:ribonuclease HII [Paracoccaceae bacterium]